MELHTSHFTYNTEQIRSSFQFSQKNLSLSGTRIDTFYPGVDLEIHRLFHKAITNMGRIYPDMGQEFRHVQESIGQSSE